MAQVDVPFITLHGNADTVVDVRSSRRLLAEAASADKTFVEVPGALHSLLCELPAVRGDVLRRISEWLAPRAAAAVAARDVQQAAEGTRASSAAE